MYEKKPRTTVDLKQNIRDEVAAIAATSNAELPETLGGNVLKTGATLRTLYSGSTGPSGRAV